MVVEEILTSLRNAVEHGDSLQNAVQLAISSGYNPRDVQEAAQFVSSGSISFLQSKPTEQFAMPAEKKIFTNNPVSKTQQQIAPIKPMPPIQQRIPDLPENRSQQIIEQQENIRQDTSAIKQNISSGAVYSSNQIQTQPYSNGYLSNQVTTITHKKESYTKEIILLIVLLLLIVTLITSFVFKTAILDFFSKL